MPLCLIPLPLGNSKDISLRALDEFKCADVAIVENKKAVMAMLRSYGMTTESIYELNVHTEDELIAELLQLCETKRVILVSDCGTPGFEDPGHELVRACRNKEIPVNSLPGASSLTLLVSLSSERLSQFFVRGFLPRESGERQKAWIEVKTFPGPQILLETPYRCRQFAEELAQNCPERKVLFACELTTSQEWIFEGSARSLPLSLTQKFGKKPKIEFCTLIYSIPQGRMPTNSSK
ncbi:MAG: SAM-dependent methyltransferase [Bdellovibrio sp.]